MAFGTVYVFNLYSQPVTTISINNMPTAGTIAAPAKGSASPFWAPPQLAVPRTNLQPGQLDSSMFCVGPNSVNINYGGQNWTGTITIPAPPNPPLQRDLWLYVAFQQMFLFDSADGSIITQPAGGALQAGEGGGGNLSAPLTKQGGSKAAAGSSGGGSKGGGSKGGGSKGGGSKSGASKGGASKGGAKSAAKGGAKGGAKKSGR